MLSKYFLSASDLNELTVCGVFAASIVKLMSPALVFRAKVYFAFWSIAISGEGDCLGSGSDGEADGFADGSAAWSFLSLSKTPPTIRPTSVATTTATAAPITAARWRAFLRASARRACWRSYFSLASCRRR